jgi:hypothetical protein
MTDRKHLKARVRARMARTGERYAAARAHVAGDEPGTGLGLGSGPHGPVTIPGAAALSAILADAGISIDEPLALVVGGGLGMGVFQFHYQREGTSTFFIAGRHRWDDDLAFLRAGVARLGLDLEVAETTSPRTAERQLRDALGEGRRVVAWLDFAELGTRAYPADWSGGAYHVVVVRSIDEERGTATIDDLAAAPIEVPLDVLAQARARIRAGRHRLAWVAPGSAVIEPAALDEAILAGLAAMIDGLDHPRSRSFGLDALGAWAARLGGSGRDGWMTVFPPGPRLVAGLAAIYEHIEHYGSGGGLLRPRFAAGLAEAAARLADERLAGLAERYRSLGDRWTELARAALPDDVPALRRTRELIDRRATAYAERGAAAHDELAAAWAETLAIRAAARAETTLDAGRATSLLAGLAERVEALRAAEVNALEGLRSAMAGPA